MNQIDLEIYVYALYFLMILSISAFILVIRKIESDEVPVLSLKYFTAYFIMGIIGWIGLGIKDSANIDTDLSMAVFVYILASGLLLIAIAEFDGKQIFKRAIVIFAHVFIAAISFLPNSDPHRILFLAVYSAFVYPHIFYISFKRARQRRNFGHAIICAATLLVIIIIPFQFYAVLVVQNFSIAYGLTLIASTSGYMLVGIGFLTKVLITENKKLKLLALYDPLTGLYNRRGMDFSLYRSIASAHRSGKCISAINIDIDFFKNINDTHGHDGGDFVLQKISEILLKSVRPNDVCCRLGGEEFVIVLPETCQDYAVLVAERIRLDIEILELTYMRKTVKLTSSFGVATHCEDADIDYLLKDADKALYAAKAEGRNKVCVADSNQ